MKRLLIMVLFIVSISLCLTSCIKTHQHEYSNDYKYDSSYHWKESMCNHGDSELEAHDMKCIETKPATFSEEGYELYECSVCDYNEKISINKLLHTYSTSLSYDDETHWYACIDLGYEELKSNEEKHVDSNEVIIIPSTETTVGLGEYTCSVCGHLYQKNILINMKIIELPSVNMEAFVGQSLKDIELVGGGATVEGSFSFTNPDEIITESKEYSVTFYPDEDDKYSTAEAMIYIEATQLSVFVLAHENGTVNPTGAVNVDYNGSLELNITPDLGYQVKEIIVDGESVGSKAEYILDNITSFKNVEVFFEEKADLPFTLVCNTGDNDCYSFNDNILYFNNISENTSYYISGELNGNIIIDIGDDYDFELELQGFTLSSDSSCPIVILSGNEVSISAKKDYENYIYDYRELVEAESETDYSASIYSMVDLKIKGKGSLAIESTNNNGIHSKNDLEVKNLFLEINVCDNALKGNDSLSLENVNANLIAKSGDTLKTTNSDISDKGNQRGTITITGGEYNLYSACDAIDAAYDVVINDSTTVLNIYTDKYSSYSEEVTANSVSSYYIRYSSNSYKYSVKYYNSDTDYIWVAPEYYTSVAGGRSTYYYYKFNKLNNYSKLAVYMHSSSQDIGQEESYYATTGYISINESYDTIAFSNKMGGMSYSWTNYTTQSNGNMWGGMIEGNTDKGDYSTKGIKSANQIIINSGIITIKAYDDAIHANGDVQLENGTTPLGNVTINGGDLTIYSNDDGIHADGVLLVSGGSINITNSYEGIEGNTIKLTNGNVSIISSDDGMNSAATSGTGISISGGNLYIYAMGDGIDSNSKESYNAIAFDGGNTVVICNSNGNSAIDSDGGYNYNGGYVLAMMPNGGMTSESTHCSNFQSIGKTTTVSLSSGGYCVVSSIVTVKMPVSMQAFIVLLGSSSASINSASSTTNTLDNNGVCWN